MVLVMLQGPTRGYMSNDGVSKLTFINRSGGMKIENIIQYLSEM